MTDRSTYHGEVNNGAFVLPLLCSTLTNCKFLDGIPDGVGVLLSVFGATYAGAMADGKKHGAGVEMQTNGTIYSGEFQGGVASGYGIYIGTLGDKYIGQWEQGARHGVGVSVDAEAVIMTTHFSMDEPVLSSNESGTTLSWEDVQPHVLRAVLAEKTAIRNQETARQRHIDAIVQDMTAVGSETLSTHEAIEAFEAREEMETTEFILDQSDQMQQVNVVAGELKFTEAQLTQRQKELRTDITAKRQQLSLIAKFCALVETRESQVQEAKRTLATLQRQLDVQVPNIANAADSSSATEPERHVRTASPENF
ncbi:AAA domain containing hypothetical protein [Phytophthora palmivora]|uniref:Uncharacterized protein n=1 Tax=Phytophthora palmivora TaxID=4796 RepID=A0A2P4XZZ3_9STRA|nr:AAA domain containing hypothetical protein [Phytophthora palmivora]